MRKLVPAAFVILCFAASVLFAHHGPEKVTINAAAKKQPGVVLDHTKHATVLVKSCDTCHHTNKGMTTDKGAKVQKCSACHLDPKPNVPGMREMAMTKNPFHMVCVDCHKKAAPKKGPTACTGCHKK